MNKQSMDLFREACAMTGPLQLRVDYPGVAEPLQWVLYQPFALIGREPRAHLLLDHDEISRRHAYLQVVGGRIFFMDLESRMGTHWQDGPHRTGWLDEEQIIRIGPYTVRHNSNGQNGTGAGASAESHAKPSFPGRQGIPEVTLEFVNKTGRSSTWQMTPLLALVGSSPDCRVHLVGQSVSNFHCSLVRTPLGVWVVDLFGRGGVRVNTELVRQCLLEAGDHVQVGRFLMRVHYDTQPMAKFHTDAAPRFQGSTRQPEEATSQAQTSAAVAPPITAQAPEVVITPTIVPPVPGVPAESDTSTQPGRDLVPFPVDQTSQGSEAAQNLLVPLAHQLSLMQKQMFDQFQQAMMMMFQMFNTLQKDQIGVIRQELDQLHGLTQELNKLQAELSKRAQQTNTAGVATPADPRIKSVHAAPLGTTSASAPRSAGTPPPTAPAATSPVSAAAQGQASPADQNTEAFHLWLSDRVKAIQEERQTRWQKIANFLGRK